MQNLLSIIIYGYLILCKSLEEKRVKNDKTMHARGPTVVYGHLRASWARLGTHELPQVHTWAHRPVRMPITSH